MVFERKVQRAGASGGVGVQTFPLTIEAPRSARRWLAERLSASPIIRDRVALLTSELVANSIVHSGLTAPEEVEVSVRPIPNGVRVAVTDDGVGFPVVGRPSEDSYGLRLVEAVADRWGHRDHPTRVWFDVTG
jgi:two-component sensor histidine kinase